MAEMREVHSKILDISKRADHDVSEVKKVIMLYMQRRHAVIPVETLSRSS